MNKTVIILICSALFWSTAVQAGMTEAEKRRKMLKNRSDYQTLSRYVRSDIEGDLERPTSFYKNSSSYLKNKNTFNFYLIGSASIILYNNLRDLSKEDNDSGRSKVLSKNTQWVFEYLEYEKKQCEDEYLNLMLQGDQSAAQRFKSSNNFAGVLSKLMTNLTFEDFYEKKELHSRYSHIPRKYINPNVPREKTSRDKFISNYYSIVDYIKNGQDGFTISVDAEMVRRRHIWQMYKKFFGITENDGVADRVRNVPNMGCNGYYKYMDANIEGYAINLSEESLRDAKNKIGLSRKYVTNMWEKDICPRLDKIHSCYQALMTDLDVFSHDSFDQYKRYQLLNDFFEDELYNVRAINKE